MKQTILFIDDQSDLLDIVRIVLTDAGYDVVVSADCSIIPDLKTIKPDLILMDCWLRDGNGEEICLALKQSKDFQHIPILLISATNNLAEKARNAKADGFICKPFNIDDFVNQIESYLETA